MRVVTFHQDQQARLQELGSGQAEVLHILRQFQGQMSNPTESCSTSFVPLSEPRLRKKKRSNTQTAMTDLSNCTCDAKTHVGYPATNFCLQMLRNALSLNVVKETEESTIHDRYCPLRYQSMVYTVYRLHSRVFGWSLSGPVELQKLLYLGLRGLQISPSLTIRPIVSSNSPTFRVLRDTSGFGG